jgi:hypothetical protein
VDEDVRVSPECIMATFIGLYRRLLLSLNFVFCVGEPTITYTGQLLYWGMIAGGRTHGRWRIAESAVGVIEVLGGDPSIGTSARAPRSLADAVFGCGGWLGSEGAKRSPRAFRRQVAKNCDAKFD